MNYKFFLLLIIFLPSCVQQVSKNDIEIKALSSNFESKGFALIYEDTLYKKKIIKRKIEKRSLIIFQKNLKNGTIVKITNLINSKNLIAKVGKNTEYPAFFNSVISIRISQELEIDKDEPYIEIMEINTNSSFVAGKAKTYDEEKNVATKAPVEDVLINDLSKVKTKKSREIKSEFSYIIKIADFYFEKSAIEMKSRLSEETSVKNIGIKKLSNTKYRVFLGPYDNINSLKKSFNAINILQFENIEIIKK